MEFQIHRSNVLIGEGDPLTGDRLFAEDVASNDIVILDGVVVKNRYGSVTPLGTISNSQRIHIDYPLVSISEKPLEPEVEYIVSPEMRVIDIRHMSDVSDETDTSPDVTIDSQGIISVDLDNGDDGLYKTDEIEKLIDKLQWALDAVRELEDRNLIG